MKFDKLMFVLWRQIRYVCVVSKSIHIRKRCRIYERENVCIVTHVRLIEWEKGRKKTTWAYFRTETIGVIFTTETGNDTDIILNCRLIIRALFSVVSKTELATVQCRRLILRLCFAKILFSLAIQMWNTIPDWSSLCIFVYGLKIEEWGCFCKLHIISFRNADV